MKTLDLTWKRVTKVWWGFVWRAAVVGGLATVAVGYLLGFALAAVGVGETTLETILTLTPMVIAVPVGIWAMSKALNIRYSDFSLVLSSSDPIISAHERELRAKSGSEQSEQPQEQPRKAA